MTGRLILIGMPASGKTTIGAALARALSVPFYDTDTLAEQTAGRSIPVIFAAEGEAAFRALERRTLETLCAETETPCVIATGGGAVLTEQNRELLRRSGTVFWLDRTVDNIMSTDYAAGRPLLAGGEAALRALYAVRCPLYAACAHYRVPDGTVDQMKDFILRLWRDTP